MFLVHVWYGGTCFARVDPLERRSMAFLVQATTPESVKLVIDLEEPKYRVSLSCCSGSPHTCKAGLVAGMTVEHFAVAQTMSLPIAQSSQMRRGCCKQLGEWARSRTSSAYACISVDESVRGIDWNCLKRTSMKMRNSVGLTGSPCSMPTVMRAYSWVYWPFPRTLEGRRRFWTIRAVTEGRRS